MDKLQSFNLEYFLYQFFHFFSGVDANAVPGSVVGFFTQLALFGLALAFFFLIGATYSLIRLTVAEHERQGRAAAEAQKLIQHAEATGKNMRWEQVVSLGSSPNESDWRRAILEADIMLADALSERGFVGGTLADQLRSANPLQFTTLDLAWAAHKMRNAVAHLGEAFPLSERDVRATIDQYRQVFEEFGII